MENTSKIPDQGKNSMIDRFEVSRLLGKGLQGKVYLGWDPDLERQVALKVITPTEYDTGNSQDIIAEARIAAKISHPNVVPIYEVGMYKNTPLLIFEYVDGVTLRHYLIKRGRLDEDEAVSIIFQIASGLASAHEKGIVHLDLSPKNIMIDNSNKPHIMDFGLARVTCANNKIKNHKKFAATPRYMTPEHIAGKDFSPASDIFSLGLIFYELLAGMRAINGKTIDEIVDAIAVMKIDWGKLQHLGITPEIISAIRDMLHPDPIQRYASACELVPVLNDIMTIQRSEDKGALSLDFLLRRLQRQPEFPACSHSISEINRLTAEDSDTNFNKLGAVIVRDYTLTNRVMKIANSVVYDRHGDGVKTISQAIARLGLKLVRMICNGLLLFNQADDKDSKLKDILVASFVAGLIARHISASINRRIAEEAFICALFHNLGNHLLVFYLPDEFDDINALIEKGEEVHVAERAILATTTSALGMAVAEKWNFPITIINCMTHLPPGILETPKNDEDTLRHAANFANELCALVLSNAEGRDLLLEVNPFIERHKVIYKGDVKKLAQLTTSAAEKFEELAPGLGINYNDSNFCQHLSNFSTTIEDAQNQEEIESVSNF